MTVSSQNHLLDETGQNKQVPEVPPKPPENAPTQNAQDYEQMLDDYQWV